MSYRFGKRSSRLLKYLHPDGQRVCHRAIELTDLDFTIIETRRSWKRQKQLVATGASTTMNSRHLIRKQDQYCHAWDIAPYVKGKIRWDWPLFHRLEVFFAEAARIEDVPVKWGGHWKNFPDGPHRQLKWKAYP
jgi:peptidoglycan L-alanyl-D-glutamate endopeptidase CwlK